jgi:hypothetical protein
MIGVSLLLGKEALVIDDDETKIADTGFIGTAIIDLVENSMAQREPDAALSRSGRCRRPTWRSRSSAAEYRATPAQRMQANRATD